MSPPIGILTRIWVSDGFPSTRFHSPIKKVNYLVEAARLGQTTDYDKLTVDVWTDGAVSARDAMSLSAKLLRDHLNIFINIDEPAEPAKEPTTDEPTVIVKRAPRQERRRAGAVGALVQLSEERKHPDSP